MKHFDNLTNKDLNKMKIGEEFTYKSYEHSGIFYKKGMIVAPGIMIPIGLLCKTIEIAQKQY